MNRLFSLTAIVLAILAMPAFSQKQAFSRNYIAGEMLEKKFYWQTRDLTYDTLGWDKLTGYESTDGYKGVAQACGPLQEADKQAFFLKDITALSAVILIDLGYEIYVLTQWGGKTQEAIKVSVPGLDQDYRERSIFTDFLWEKVTRYEIEKPTDLQPDYEVKLYFGNNGYAIYPGREKLRTNAAQILGTTSGLVLEMDISAEDLPVRRLVHQAYLIAGDSARSGKVVRKVEKSMDKLGLDLSYKPPVVKPVECE